MEQTQKVPLYPNGPERPLGPGGPAFHDKPKLRNGTRHPEDRSVQKSVFSTPGWTERGRGRVEGTRVPCTHSPLSRKVPNTDNSRPLWSRASSTEGGANYSIVSFIGTKRQEGKPPGRRGSLRWKFFRTPLPHWTRPGPRWWVTDSPAPGRSGQRRGVGGGCTLPLLLGAETGTCQTPTHWSSFRTSPLQLPHLGPQSTWTQDEDEDGKGPTHWNPFSHSRVSDYTPGATTRRPLPLPLTRPLRHPREIERPTTIQCG